MTDVPPGDEGPAGDPAEPYVPSGRRRSTFTPPGSDPDEPQEPDATVDDDALADALAAQVAMYTTPITLPTVEGPPGTAAQPRAGAAARAEPQPEPEPRARTRTTTRTATRADPGARTDAGTRDGDSRGRSRPPSPHRPPSRRSPTNSRRRLIEPEQPYEPEQPVEPERARRAGAVRSGCGPAVDAEAESRQPLSDDELMRSLSETAEAGSTLAAIERLEEELRLARAGRPPSRSRSFRRATLPVEPPPTEPRAVPTSRPRAVRARPAYDSTPVGRANRAERGGRTAGRAAARAVADAAARRPTGHRPPTTRLRRPSTPRIWRPSRRPSPTSRQTRPLFAADRRSRRTRATCHRSRLRSSPRNRRSNSPGTCRRSCSFRRRSSNRRSRRRRSPRWMSATDAWT